MSIHTRWSRRYRARLAPRRTRALRLEPLEHRLAFAAGGLDSTFGVGGIVETPFTANQSSYDYLTDIAVQADDRLLLFGPVSLGGWYVKALVRLLPDGQIDTSFGNGGRVIENWGTSTLTGQVVVQPDGRIVVAAEGSGGDLHVARYLSNGERDATFGSNGEAVYFFAHNIAPWAMELQSDGEILIAGTIGTDEVVNGYVLDDSFVMRLAPDGRRDPTFGDGGMATFSVIDFHESASQIAVQAGGAIVVAGTAISADRDRFIYVARFRSNGTLDETFGSLGYRAIIYGQDSYNFDSQKLGLVVQPSGRVLVAATRPFGSIDTEFTLAAFTPDGMLDESFGFAGIRSTPIPGASTPSVLGLIARPDGKLLALGQFSSDTTSFLVQYNADGTPDSSWRNSGFALFSGLWSVRGFALNSRGQVAISFEGNDAHGRPDFAVALVGTTGFIDVTFGTRLIDNVPSYSNAQGQQIAIQADGRVVVAGSCDVGTSPPWCVTRYNENGSVDSTFGTSGRAYVGPEYSGDPSLLLDPKGRAVLVGLTGDLKRISIVRLNGNGLPDSNWGVNGQLDVDIGVSYLGSINAVMQSDGKLLVSCFADLGNQRMVYRFVRLNVDGELDRTFGTQGMVDLSDEPIDRANSLVFVQSDDRPVLVSTFFDPLIRVHRFTSAGVRDATWGIGGVTSITSLPEGAFVYDGAILANGELLLTCSSYAGDFFLKLDREGQPVLSFGDQGILWNPQTVAVPSFLPTSVIALPQEGWAAMVWSELPPGWPAVQSVVEYFHDDGTVDFSLGDGGVVRFDTGTSDNMVWGGQLDSTGNLLVSGAIRRILDQDFMVVRLTGNGAAYRPWHNATHPLNVDADVLNDVTPLDALLVINDLNRFGSRRLAPPPAHQQVRARIDVDDDGFVTPLDALLVINHLNGIAPAEGESSRANLSPRVPKDPGVVSASASAAGHSNWSEPVEVEFLDLSWVAAMDDVIAHCHPVPSAIGRRSVRGEWSECPSSEITKTTLRRAVVVD